MWLLILSVLGALLISGLCSLMEATLLSLRPGQIAEISIQRPRIGGGMASPPSRHRTPDRGDPDPQHGRAHDRCLGGRVGVRSAFRRKMDLGFLAHLHVLDASVHGDSPQGGGRPLQPVVRRLDCAALGVAGSRDASDSRGRPVHQSTVRRHAVPAPSSYAARRDSPPWRVSRTSRARLAGSRNRSSSEARVFRAAKSATSCDLASTLTLSTSRRRPTKSWER